MLAPDALPRDLRVSVELAGRPENAVAEALLGRALTRDLPDLALVPARDVPRLTAAGLLIDLAGERGIASARRQWYPIQRMPSATDERPDSLMGYPAGFTLPLVLARSTWLGDTPLPQTWPALFALAAASPPDGVTMLDPGPFTATVDWLRQHAGLSAHALPPDEPAQWDALLGILRALHDAPSATRFWQKRWAPGTPTFLRGRTVLGLGDTEALRARRAVGPDIIAGPWPAFDKDYRAVPISVPALWVVPTGTDLERVRPLLRFIASSRFAAMTAERRGWAPVRRDAWRHMRALIARIPAWQTVRGILESQPLSVESVGERADGNRAALARAAGLWLAGLLPNASHAWQAAEADASAEAHARDGGDRVQQPVPYLRASSLRTARTRARVTLVQGERRLLPGPLRLGHGLWTTERTSVRLRSEGAAVPVTHVLYTRPAGRDELQPVSGSAMPIDVDTPLYVEIEAPSDLSPGEYALELELSNARTPATMIIPLGPLRITLRPTAMPAVAALAGLGLPEASPYTASVGALLLDHGFTPFPIPFDSPLRDDPRRGPVVPRRWHDPTKAEADARAARAAGLLGDVLEYSHDEPTLLHFPHIRNEAAQYARLGLRVLVTHPPDPELEGTAQVWGVHTALRPTDTPSAPEAWRTTLRRIATARAREEDVWWYTAGDVAPLPNLQLDANLTQLRAAFFRLPALGFSGVLQPEVAAWGAIPRALDRGALGIGEGVLCFPSPGGRSNVYPTLRLKALRDGVATMQLLAALDAQLTRTVGALPDAEAWAEYPGERLAAYGRSVVQPAALALGQAVHPLMHLTTDERGLRETGATLRVELESALRGALLLVRGEPLDWTVTTAHQVRLSGRTIPRAQVTIAGEGVPVTAGGHFTWEGPLGEGWNAIEVRARTADAARSLTWHVWRAAPLSPR